MPVARHFSFRIIYRRSCARCTSKERENKITNPRNCNLFRANEKWFVWIVYESSRASCVWILICELFALGIVFQTNSLGVWGKCASIEMCPAEKTISVISEIDKDIGKSFASFIKLQIHKFIGDVSSSARIVSNIVVFNAHIVCAFILRRSYVSIHWMNYSESTNNLYDVRIGVPVSNSFYFLFRHSDLILCYRETRSDKMDVNT